MSLIILFILLQISPGELTKFHKSLDGFSNCLRCHSAGRKIDNKKCLSCHEEIKALILKQRGYHFRVFNIGCESCHKEHFGRDFEIVKFDERKFDHAQTTFALSGFHTKLKCSECHNAKFIADEKLKNRSGTYLGLEISCSGCHFDVHKGEFTEGCEKCHTANGWNEARTSFNHDVTRFKLTGSHLKVKCEGCHNYVRNSGRKARFVIFKRKKFSFCSDCHQDVHRGKFGICDECHTTNRWGELRVSFDHNLTGFELKGRHSELKCVKCHHTSGRDSNTYEVKFKIKHSRCLDCHSDFHKGVFVKRSDGGDCSSCHNEDGFLPTTFTVRRHETESRFILRNSHASVPCSDCHLSGESLKFRWADLNCEVCHKDSHSGQFANNEGRTYCDRCHRETRWKDLIFDHDKTKFKLTGAHKKVECSKCHVQTIANFVRYVGTPIECVKCHQDVHLGQFAVDGFVNCEVCHVPDGWKNLLFDHDRDSRFKLTGAHRQVQCSSCHKKEFVEGREFIRYKPLPTNCEGCHGT